MEVAVFRSVLLFARPLWGKRLLIGTFEGVYIVMSYAAFGSSLGHSRQVVVNTNLPAVLEGELWIVAY